MSYVRCVNCGNHMCEDYIFESTFTFLDDLKKHLLNNFPEKEQYTDDDIYLLQDIYNHYAKDRLKIDLVNFIHDDIIDIKEFLTKKTRI